MSQVVITGGGRGLGRATALKFAARGHNVAITYQSNKQAAARVVDEILEMGTEAFAVQMDVGVQSDIDRGFDEIEGRVNQIEYLFNNAGIINGLAEMHDQSWTSWERIFAVDVIGQWYCAKRAAAHMIGNGIGGAILYCASISGVMTFPMATDYAAAKHAVVGMAKGQALECAQHGIRINTLCPGFLKTDMYEENFAAATETLTNDMIPASRIAGPEEIADLAYWVLVDGTYCYGSVLVADGGILAGPKHQPV